MPGSRRTPQAISRLASRLPWLALVAMLALLLYAAGRPLRTADLWLHLALGAAYAAQGPWLDADPILYTAQGPPLAAAWLSDLALHGVENALGFQGLRALHVLAVLGSVALAWSLLRRASDSSAFACLGTLLFVDVAGFRLLQLRPQLVTIAFVLLLYRLLLASRRPASGWHIAGAVLLLAVWANAHAGFLLGPALLAAAVCGATCEATLSPRPARPAARARARALALALLLGLPATLLNPDGVAPHLALVRAGIDSPALEMVLDEWRPFPFLGPLLEGLPPSPSSFVTSLVLIALAPLLAAWTLWRWRRGEATAADPAVIACACAGAIATALATRFQWLGVFSLLAIGPLWPRTPARGGRNIAAALAALLLLGAWIRAGDWPRLSEGLPRTLQGYAAPYAATPYYGHAVWFLRDTKLQGHLANRYVHGNFLGYWLAPALKPFFAGSLNVPAEVAQAHAALNRRRGLGALDFEQTLDRFEVDVFLGTGVPGLPPDARPHVYTTPHLEGVTGKGVEGWALVFRNLRSSVWLRRGPRNAGNLARVARWYAEAGVPFEASLGFEAERVLAEAPSWAIDHGLAPWDYQDLRAHAAAGALAARSRLATLYAVLGLYERAIELDRELLAQHEASDARRRLVWCLLRLGRAREARRAAQALERQARPGSLAASLVQAATDYPVDASAGERAAFIAPLRLLTASEARGLFVHYVEPRARPYSARPTPVAHATPVPPRPQ